MKLGRYQVVRHLASGGMAEVLLARASGLEGFTRHVVIKRIRPGQAKDQSFVQMFLNEARLAAQLHHQNIVQVHDIGQEGNEYFFAMEYVHGEDLRHLLTQVTKLKQKVPIEHVVSIVSAAAAALHHAHEQRGADRTPLGIVHRDVTPANILVSYDGHVKVVDFGIAKAAARTHEATQAGTLKGKASYMSPEQCTGNAPVDRRSDVFALGIVLYELATARRLFKGENDFLTMSAIVGGKVPPATNHRHDLPDALDAIIMKALSLEPANRYQTAEAMREALEQFAVRSQLHTTASSLATYMKTVFGERPEPWLLSAEDAEMEVKVDFDGSASGMVRPPTESIESNAIPESVAAAKSSPIVKARTTAATGAPPLASIVTPATKARTLTKQIPIVHIDAAGEKSRTGARSAVMPAAPEPVRKKTKTVQIPAASQTAALQPAKASETSRLPGVRPIHDDEDEDAATVVASGVPRDIDTSWDASRPMQVAATADMIAAEQATKASTTSPAAAVPTTTATAKPPATATAKPPATATAKPTATATANATPSASGARPASSVASALAPASPATPASSNSAPSAGASSARPASSVASALSAASPATPASSNGAPSAGASSARPASALASASPAPASSNGAPSAGASSARPASSAASALAAASPATPASSNGAPNVSDAKASTSAANGPGQASVSSKTPVAGVGVTGPAAPRVNASAAGVNGASATNASGANGGAKTSVPIKTPAAGIGATGPKAPGAPAKGASSVDSGPTVVGGIEGATAVGGIGGATVVGGIGATAVGGIDGATAVGGIGATAVGGIGRATVVGGIGATAVGGIGATAVGGIGGATVVGDVDSGKTVVGDVDSGSTVVNAAPKAGETKPSNAAKPGETKHAESKPPAVARPSDPARGTLGGMAKTPPAGVKSDGRLAPGVSGSAAGAAAPAGSAAAYAASAAKVGIGSAAPTSPPTAPSASAKAAIAASPTGAASAPLDGLAQAAAAEPARKPIKLPGMTSSVASDDTRAAIANMLRAPAHGDEKTTVGDSNDLVTDVAEHDDPHDAATVTHMADEPMESIVTFAEPLPSADIAHASLLGSRPAVPGAAAEPAAGRPPLAMEAPFAPVAAAASEPWLVEAASAAPARGGFFASRKRLVIASVGAVFLGIVLVAVMAGGSKEKPTTSAAHDHAGATDKGGHTAKGGTVAKTEPSNDEAAPTAVEVGSAEPQAGSAEVPVVEPDDIADGSAAAPEPVAEPVVEKPPPPKPKRVVAKKPVKRVAAKKPAAKKPVAKTVTKTATKTSKPAVQKPGAKKPTWDPNTLLPPKKK
jgi:serine/threonine-protein kinase